MRLRVAVPLLVVVVAALALLVTPVMESIAERRTAAIELERREVVMRTVELARVAIEDDDPAPLQRHVERYFALFGEAVLVVDGAGAVLAGAGGLDAGSPEVEQRVRDFGANLAQLDIATITPWVPERVLLSSPVSIDRDLAGGVVVLEVDLARARSDVLTAWLQLLAPVSLGLLALVAATLAAVGWILRPVHRLDAATHALTSGSPVDELTLSGPPELRRLAASFRLMADTLAATVGQQRDLVANTSHQLRNPLAAVRLHVDLLADEGAADPASIEAMQRDLDRLDATVDRLLGLADAENRLNERRAELAVRHGGPPQQRLVAATTLSAHVAARWHLPDGPRVRADAEAGLVIAVGEHDLLEMVDTAVENAVKYAGAGALIEVTARGAGERALVRVEDDGAGLTDDELGQVGQRFWRSSRHADQPGTGLGLALVDALARSLGGSMTVGRSARGGLAVELDLPRGDEVRA